MPVWKLSCSGNSIELYKHQLFVGRDDDCDITFKHKGIDIRHSVLNYDQRLGVFRLTDLGSSHGTFVNGESVCEESVPLYVGTRIMFGRNPMVWCVDVGEPSTSHVAIENMTPHNYQIPRTNHGYSPLHVPYTSPRTAPMSYSFQTIFPLDRSSPQQDPLFSAGKSYLGDSSYTKDKDQSFVPAERKQSSDSCKDLSFSEKIATDSPIEPPINSLKTDADEINSEINTRAKSLYGQPSWWGDGSDSFSTPPSHRKENKPDTPHPNKSIQPPNFSIITAVPHTDTQPSKDDFSLSDKPVSLFIESRPNTAVPLTRKATEKDSKKPLARQGSYEIESDQLDLSLVRPVIDPDPPYYTPYKNGRKSEVFIVDFGDEKIESKKPIHTTPRNARQSDKPRVKLAFKETQPIEVTSDSEQELNFFSPCINSTPPLAQRRNESVVSESGDEIGEPVTSSTPISILTEDQTTNISLDSLQIVRQETPDHKERRKRTTWTAPLEPAKSDFDQSISEVSRNIDTTLTQAYTKTKLLYELLENHLTPNFHSFSSQQDNTQATLTAMKQMEEKVKSFSNLLSSVNIQELQETLYNLQSTNCNVNTIGFDPGVRRGSFDSGVHSQTEKTTQSFHT